MSFLPVLEYGAGIFAFGFVYWIMQGVIDSIYGTGMTTGSGVQMLLGYFWMGILIIYLIFGGIWMIRKYNESEYQQGG